MAFEGCNLCLVEVEGRKALIQSCRTSAENGMSVRTDSNEIKKAREENLVKMLVRHPHACLVCAQAQGCDRKICSLQIPEPERCCFKFGMCELQKVTNFIGIEKGLPPYEPLGVPVVDMDPLFRRITTSALVPAMCEGLQEVRAQMRSGSQLKQGGLWWQQRTYVESQVASFAGLH
jgi:hypothetical protein